MYRMNNSPIIIGGQGGSCTRVVAMLLKDSGKIHFLESSADTIDSLSLRESRLCKDEDLIQDLIEYTQSLNYEIDHIPRSIRDRIEGKMDIFQRLVNDELIEKLSNELWSWKEPKTIFYLPFFMKLYPNFKFIHVLRDGRGIRSLHIQGKPEIYNSYFHQNLKFKSKIIDREKFESLWAHMNLDIYDWCTKNLGDNYYQIRVEDLLNNDKKEDEIIKLYDFVDIRVDPSTIHRIIDQFRPMRKFNKTKLKEDVLKAMKIFGYVI